jgi:hypothetical protein
MKCISEWHIQQRRKDVASYMIDGKLSADDKRLLAARYEISVGSIHNDIVEIIRPLTRPRYVQAAMRRKIYARDGYVCRYCGREKPRRNLCIEHVVPRALGGPATEDNLVVACNSCNSRKGRSIWKPLNNDQTLPTTPNQIEPLSIRKTEMNNFLQCEASYLAAPEDIEPEIEDVKGKGYLCEADGCNEQAVAELSWPLEDHDWPSGCFCQLHLDKALASN